MNEILNFCKERNILLEGSLQDILLKYNDEEVKKFILDVSDLTSKKFITKKIISENKGQIKNLIKNIFSDYDSFENDLFFLKNKKENDSVKIYNEELLSKKVSEIDDFVNFYISRYKKMLGIIQKEKKTLNLSSINKIINSNQKCNIVGMVMDINKTKNGNYIIEVEDMTGKIKVIASSYSKSFFDCENISKDSILIFAGTIKGEVMFLDKFNFVGYNLDERKKSIFDENAVFIGDIHFGSKKCMKNNLVNFVNYLNSEDEEAKKIKYLFILGDLVAGVGVYPDQIKDLEIKSIEKQFEYFFDLIKKIRSDINIIIIPGNHDGLGLAEPQDKLSSYIKKYSINLDNVYFLNNPGNIEISKTKDNFGINVLCYHGFSLPYYHNNISYLLSSDSINNPIKIMKYLLKNRHLAPSHESVQHYPYRDDFLLIENIPDIFVSGHMHKSDISYENNVLFISVSSWEEQTENQKKIGNKPDFCKVPMINLKTRAVKILDFENGEGKK